MSLCFLKLRILKNLVKIVKLDRCIRELNKAVKQTHDFLKNKNITKKITSVQYSEEELFLSNHKEILCNNI